MGCFYTKQGLYTKIAKLKRHFGLELNQHPADIFDFVRQLGKITIEEFPIRTAGLRGVAVIAQEDENDLIILDSERSVIDKSFDCAHELMHLCLHRNEQTQTFNCYNEFQPQQNAFLEWQANESAAELLVPLIDFLPKIKAEYSENWECEDIANFKKRIAKEYRVPETTIKYRLESLKYEIWQHLSGIPLRDIVLLSSKKQEASGIFVDSLNDKEEQSRLYDKSVLVGHPVIYKKRCTDTVKVYI